MLINLTTILSFYKVRKTCNSLTRNVKFSCHIQLSYVINFACYAAANLLVEIGF